MPGKPPVGLVYCSYISQWGPSMGRLFLFVLAFSLLEVMVLAAAADIIGWPLTILFTVGTALLGSYLFRTQGLATWVRLNQRMQQGEMPGEEMAEGVLLLIGGVVLITPGFITDAIGFALLLPQTRRPLAKAMLRRGLMQSMVVNRQQSFYYQGSQQPPPSGPTTPSDDATSSDHQGITIDGKSRREDKE